MQANASFDTATLDPDNRNVAFAARLEQENPAHRLASEAVYIIRLQQHELDSWVRHARKWIAEAEQERDEAHRATFAVEENLNALELALVDCWPDVEDDSELSEARARGVETYRLSEAHRMAVNRAILEVVAMEEKCADLESKLRRAMDQKRLTTLEKSVSWRVRAEKAEQERDELLTKLNGV